MVHITSTPSSRGIVGVDVRILHVIAVQAIEQFALEFFAQHCGPQAVQDQQHADAAGVHNAGRLQGLELVLGPHHGFEGRFDCRVEGQAEGVVAVVTAVRLVN